MPNRPKGARGEAPRPTFKTGQPYQTQNTSIATILATCGIPFWRRRGVASGILSVYNADILRGFLNPDGTQRYPKGTEIDAATEDAWKRGLPGIIIYRFQYTPELARITDAYNKQERLIAKLEEADGGEPNPEGGHPSAEVDIELEDAARFGCQLLKNRKTYLEEWKKHPPYIVREGASRVERDGEAVITIGSMKAYPLFASAETRRRLGV